MISFVYVQIPNELARQIEQLEGIATTHAATHVESSIERDYLQLVDGYDSATDTHYPTMDLDDWLADQIWWTIDTTVIPGQSVELHIIGDNTSPLSWALFGKHLMTTVIDTGYGGPRYVPPEDILLVSGALQKLKPGEITKRMEELAQLGHIDSDHVPLIQESLDALRAFYAQALRADEGIIVTVQ